MQTQINNTTRLNEQERQNAISVFEEFFDVYHIRDAQKELKDLVEIGLTTDNDIYNCGARRGNLLYLQQNLLKLMEAALVLSKVPDESLAESSYRHS